MNKQRKYILLAYAIFLCVLALFFFLIVSYAIYEHHIAGYANVFHHVADEEEALWIRLAIIAIVNLFVFSSLIFGALLVFLKKKGSPR